MLLQVVIPLFDHHVIFQALALQLFKIDFQGPGVGQGEPHPFLPGGRRGWRRLGMKDRCLRHGGLGEGQIPAPGAAAT